MKTQIHKATADYLGIKADKEGFYFYPSGMLIPLNKHNEIIAQIQSETKAWCLSDIDKLKEALIEVYQKLQFADKKLSEAHGNIEYTIGDKSHISTGLQSTLQKYENLINNIKQ